MTGGRHFAAVIGAAGIIVGPFVATTAAHADDSVAVDPAGYIYEDKQGVSGSEQGAAFGLVEGTADGGPEGFVPIAGPNGAACLGLLVIGGTDIMVPFDVLPEDVLASLPQSGAIDGATFRQVVEAIAPYAIAEDEVISAALSGPGEGAEILVSLPFGEELAWTVVSEAAGEEPSEGVDDGGEPVEAPPAASSESGDVEPAGAPSVTVRESTVAQPSVLAQESVAVQEAAGAVGVELGSGAYEVLGGGSVDVSMSASSGPWAPSVEVSAGESVSVEAVETSEGTTLSENLQVEGREEVAVKPTLPVTGGVKAAPNVDSAAAGAKPGVSLGEAAGIGLLAAGVMGAGLGYVKLSGRKRD